MKIDGLSKLQHLLQTMAFCLAIATIQYAFQPERPYAPPVAYSLAIGLFTWAFIDLGRHLFPSSAETGWPQGAAGVLLVGGSIVGGYFLGNALADLACRTFGWYAMGPPVDRVANLRQSILITALAGIAGSFYFYAINKSAYLERKMVEARRHANDARLKLLETQLEPHMLFNTLANLRVLIGTEPARAQTMLDHMIAYLRATLDASRASTHALQDEFARLDDYLALMSVRMGPRLHYTLSLPAELADLPVPTLLLQPLVENSIKHGLEPKVEGGHITVTARRDGAGLVLEVVDTGVGLGSASHVSTGFGMAQVRERLAAVYGSAATLDAGPNGDSGGASGVRIVIRIPLAT